MDATLPFFLLQRAYFERMTLKIWSGRLRKWHVMPDLCHSSVMILW